jgi:hypothetical protein
MAVKVEVKALDVAVKMRRELAAQRVLQKFGSGLPDLELLAFFDDDNNDVIKQNYGFANLGYYRPIKESRPTKAWRPWPPRMNSLIFVDGSPSEEPRRVFDHGIYLHGSTCADETALIMTFAHELQHFVQYGLKRRLWAESRLIQKLPKEIQVKEQLNWPDLPHEREARIEAKRVGVSLLGPDEVGQYIARRISENVSVEDVEDWRFSQEVDSSEPYDLSNGIRRIFQRLKPYRRELEEVLQEMKNSNSRDDYKDVDISAYFDAD